MKTALVLLLVLTACARPDAAVPVSGIVECDAVSVRRLVGELWRDSNGSEAMREAKSKTLRVTRPGQAVTMDFRADRLNVHLDEAGVVQRVSCG